jgi:hypothetical protein
VQRAEEGGVEEIGIPAGGDAGVVAAEAGGEGMDDGAQVAAVKVVADGLAM